MWIRVIFTVVAAGAFASVSSLLAQDKSGVASSEDQMKPYSEKISATDAAIEMVPIPGGSFQMGSPEGEAGREASEGPVHKVRIAPFWMGKYEVTWDQYDIWGENVDILRRQLLGLPSTPQDEIADAVTRPTPPYTDMSFKMGKRSNPAICMTQHAARMYCRWLSAKTGRYYRLPTEAEWEYACRAGSGTAYSFGDDESRLTDYAWYSANSDGQYHKGGEKKPNAWGLYDMHGNVSEWVLDQFAEDTYASRKGLVSDPLAIPTTLYPRVVRGGGWDDSPAALRSAARIASDEDWKQQDPQEPKSIWYHTDAVSVGFRIVRPLSEPSAEEKTAKWDNTAPEQKDPVVE